MCGIAYNGKSRILAFELVAAGKRACVCAYSDHITAHSVMIKAFYKHTDKDCAKIESATYIYHMYTNEHMHACDSRPSHRFVTYI